MSGRRSIRNLVCLFTTCAASTAALGEVWQPGGSLPGFTSRPYCFGLAWRQYYFSPIQILCLGGQPFDANDDSPVEGRFDGGNWGARFSLDNGPLLGRGGGIDPTGRIIVFGGYSPDNGDTGGTNVYDPTQGMAGSLASRGSSAPKWNFAFCTDDLGRIYSLGGGNGETATSSRPNSAYCARYLAASNAWEVIAPLNQPAADGCGVFDGNGRILVIGGIDRNATTRIANVASYDIGSDTWSDDEVSDLPVVLSGASAVVGADQRIYVIGGRTGPIGSGTASAAVYVLDPGETVWRAGPSLATPRFHFAAVGMPVSDGLVINVAGGDNNSGGTATTEMLFTADCPSIVAAPTALHAYAGQTAGFSVMVHAGGPVSYEWRRDGAAMSDGPTAGGATIVGSHTTDLGIVHPSDADAGQYDCVITNPCGTITTDAVSLTVAPSPAMPAGPWQFVDLNPEGATASYCNGLDDRSQVGRADITWPNDTYHFKAAIWNGDAGGVIYLHDGSIPPPQNGPDYANAVHGHQQVGVWYQFAQNTDYPNGAYYATGAIWNDTPESRINLGFGAEPYTTDGQHQSGAIYVEDRPGDETYYPHATYWTGSAGSAESLQWPTGEISSVAYGMEWPHQYGGHAGASDGTSEFVHAMMWTGSATTGRTMHPVSAYHGGNSYILGAGDGLQAGYVGASYTVRHAAIWSNSRSSWLEIHPGGTWSEGVATSNGCQLVRGASGTVLCAGPLWSVSLTDVVPSVYTGFVPSSLHVDASGVVRIGGTAYLAATGQGHAAMLVSVPDAHCPADFTGDGQVNAADLAIQVACLQGPDVPFDVGCEATDLDGDGDVDLADCASLQAYIDTVCP